MTEFILYISTAICFVLIIEGLLYALFTDFMRKIMNYALAMPDAKLKGYGFILAALGFIVLGSLMAGSGFR